MSFVGCARERKGDSIYNNIVDILYIFVFKYTNKDLSGTPIS